MAYDYYVTRLTLDTQEILIWSRPYATDKDAIRSAKRMAKNRAIWSNANIVKLEILAKCTSMPNSEQIRYIEKFAEEQVLYLIIDNT